MLDLSKEMNDLDVLCMLGEGAFGSVKLVVYVPSRAPYALKTQQIKKWESITKEKARRRAHFNLRGRDLVSEKNSQA